MAMIGDVGVGKEVVNDMEVENDMHEGQNQGGLVICRKMLEHFPSAR